MKKSQETILGISLGMRRVGIAIGNHDELLDSQVKGFDERFSKKKIVRICKGIERIIDSYTVSGIAVKAPRKIFLNKALNSTLASLSILAGNKKIPMAIYEIEDLEERFVHSSAKNKKKLASVLLHQYPELKRHYSKIESGKGIYYLKLFEAVAAMKLFLERNDSIS